MRAVLRLLAHVAGCWVEHKWGRSILTRRGPFDRRDTHFGALDKPLHGRIGTRRCATEQCCCCETHAAYLRGKSSCPVNPLACFLALAHHGLPFRLGGRRTPRTPGILDRLVLCVKLAAAIDTGRESQKQDSQRRNHLGRWHRGNGPLLLRWIEAACHRMAGQTSRPILS